MMNNADPVDGTPAPDHALPADSRQARRQRLEHEVRMHWQRRQQAIDTSSCTAQPDSTIGPDQPCLSPPVPIGQAVVVTGGGMLLDDSAPAAERIVGSGDRMHHLAMVAGRALPAPPRARGDADALVLPPGPKSRAECRRRCGKAGFCDPSAALGCGGEYCGNANAAAREAL